MENIIAIEDSDQAMLIMMDSDGNVIQNSLKIETEIKVKVDNDAEKKSDVNNEIDNIPQDQSTSEYHNDMEIENVMEEIDDEEDSSETPKQRSKVDLIQLMNKNFQNPGPHWTQQEGESGVTNIRTLQDRENTNLKSVDASPETNLIKSSDISHLTTSHKSNNANIILTDFQITKENGIIKSSESQTDLCNTSTQHNKTNAEFLSLVRLKVETIFFSHFFSLFNPPFII